MYTRDQHSKKILLHETIFVPKPTAIRGFCSLQERPQKEMFLCNIILAQIISFTRDLSHNNFKDCENNCEVFHLHTRLTSCVNKLRCFFTRLISHKNKTLNFFRPFRWFLYEIILDTTLISLWDEHQQEICMDAMDKACQWMRWIFLHEKDIRYIYFLSRLISERLFGKTKS